MALYVNAACISHHTKPILGDCSAKTEPYAEVVALLLFDDKSKSGMVPDLASHPQPPQARAAKNY